MKLEMDRDLKAVVEYMQAHVPAGKLMSVVEGLAALAPAFWGGHGREPLEALKPVPEYPARPSKPTLVSSPSPLAQWEGATERLY